MRNERISLGTWALWALTSTGTALALEPTSTAASAEPTADSTVEQGRRPHGPPPEALQACADSSAGDACSFEHDGHSVDVVHFEMIEG